VEVNTDGEFSVLSKKSGERLWVSLCGREKYDSTSEEEWGHIVAQNLVLWDFVQKTYGLAPQLGDGDGAGGMMEWVVIPDIFLPKSERPWGGIEIKVDPWNYPSAFLTTGKEFENGKPSQAVLDSVKAFTGFEVLETGESWQAPWGCDNYGDEQYILSISHARHIVTGATRGYFDPSIL
jgi:hypothetical protein